MMLKVTLKRSLIGRPETQRRTVRALGLRKVNSVSMLPDLPTVRGQIFKVKHLVCVEEIADVEKKVDVKKGPAIAEKIVESEVAK